MMAEKPQINVHEGVVVPKDIRKHIEVILDRLTYYHGLSSAPLRNIFGAKDQIIADVGVSSDGTCIDVVISTKSLGICTEGFDRIVHIKPEIIWQYRQLLNGAKPDHSADQIISEQYNELIDLFTETKIGGENLKVVSRNAISMKSTTREETTFANSKYAVSLLVNRMNKELGGVLRKYGLVTPVVRDCFQRWLKEPSQDIEKWRKDQSSPTPLRISINRTIGKKLLRFLNDTWGIDKECANNLVHVAYWEMLHNFMHYLDDMCIGGFPVDQVIGKRPSPTGDELVVAMVDRDPDTYHLTKNGVNTRHVPIKRYIITMSPLEPVVTSIEDWEKRFLGKYRHVKTPAGEFNGGYIEQGMIPQTKHCDVYRQQIDDPSFCRQWVTSHPLYTQATAKSDCPELERFLSYMLDDKLYGMQHRQVYRFKDVRIEADGFMVVLELDCFEYNPVHLGRGIRTGVNIKVALPFLQGNPELIVK